jgi:S-(hydroxymethyl)glutathione dehydrogenase / alcohol dehydrogenase
MSKCEDKDCLGLDSESTDTSSEAESSSAENTGSLSRRSMLKTGALGAMAAGLAATDVQGQVAPAINTGSVQGMPFRALIRYGTGTSIENLRLKDIKPSQVVVRTKASCGCYSVCPTVLSTREQAVPTIPNHSGMGVVEAIGSQVRRVQVGDRVVVSGTPWCGRCYQCLNGAPEWCSYLAGAVPNDPIAEMEDGTGVIEMSVIGGLSEIMVAFEEYCIPVFTDLPDEQVAMLGDTFAAGIASTSTYAPVVPGSNVVVFGAGPVGLAAIQGARAHSAGQIIAVEPISYRRDKAIECGATTVLDPNIDTDTLVQRIRDLCEGPTDRVDAGGRVSGGFISLAGADFVVEATGGDNFVPEVEQGPDPTGLLALRQAWDLTAAGGHLTTLAIFQQGNIEFPTSAFCISGKNLHGGQMGGMNVMRDTPRYVTMMETGAVDVSKIITATYPLNRTVEAFERVAARTELGAVITF